MPVDSPNLTMTGFHGCDADSVPSIKADNFKCSTGEHHWLGEGVYFFSAGISNPSEDAQRWAIAQSWDSRTGSRSYLKFSVLKAEISPANPLDMTNDTGKAKVNLAREALTRRMKPQKGYVDNAIIQWLAEKYGFDVLVQDFYIQMTRERKMGLRSRFPNVRVICVRKPHSAIDKDSISVTYTALIPSNPI